MTKANKKPAQRERVVYEVKGSQKGTEQITASSTAELKKALENVLNLEPYSVQAAAHLAHVERATVTGNGWSVRRVGVMAFVPDAAPSAAPKKAQQPSQQAPKETQICLALFLGIKRKIQSRQ